ncbi:hypothetical protein LCGC14_2207990 [marine sediment metagenome]|uniref:Uncharacterized protein n=1 Tax=marine sediment metagenome TaxID=412755 RepID=A0A0F9DEU0_9ZZZZ
MSDRLVKFCNGKNCKEFKRESNKWWILLEHPSGVFVTTSDLLEGLPAMFDRDGFTQHDACGEACLQSIFAAWTSRAHDPAIPELEEMLTAIEANEVGGLESSP